MIKFSKFLIALVPFLLASQFAFTQDAESSSAIIDTIKLGAELNPIENTMPSQIEIVTPQAPEGVSLSSIVRGIIGMMSILLIAFLFSKKKRSINWLVVSMGIGIQIALAVGVLYVPFIKSFFEILARCFVKVMDFSGSGADFLFGPLLNTQGIGYIFVFQVLPTIVFFSALRSEERRVGKEC